MRQTETVVTSATANTFGNSVAVSKNLRFWHIVAALGTVTLEMVTEDGKFAIDRIAGQWGEEKSIESYKVKSTVASDAIELCFSDTPEFDIPGIIKSGFAIGTRSQDQSFANTITTANQPLIFGLTPNFLTGESVGVLNVVGTYTGTLTVQGSVDGTNFYPIPVYAVGTFTPYADGTLPANVEGLFLVPVAGLKAILVQDTVAWTGSALVNFRASNGYQPVPTNITRTILSKRYNGNPGAVETQVIAAVAGKTIYVTGFSLSVDTSQLVLLHHTAASAAANNIGGGYYPAFGGEVHDFALPVPGIVNSPVYVLPATAGNVDVTVFYYTA